MAQRWAQQKLDRAKAQRDKRLGRHKPWHAKAELAPTVAVELPTPKGVTYGPCDHVEIKRIPCKGIMPQGGISRTMRKARHAPVELWTGGKQRANRNHVAPAGPGLLKICASTDTTWRIVKKA